MNHQQIIELAREAGLSFVPEANSPLVKIVMRAVEIEREAYNRENNAAWKLMCDKMVKAEREECAKVCESLSGDLRKWPDAPEGATSETKFIRGIGEAIHKPFADAIRARGQQ